MKRLPVQPKLTALLALLLMAACAHWGAQKPEPETDNIYQYQTFGGLLAGALEGVLPYSVLQEKGDFGIGTFDGLDGEMWALDGNFYQILSDGKAVPVTAGQKAPFATVKRFRADLIIRFDEPLSCVELFDKLDALLPTLNVPYAVRIGGEFAGLKTRSVAKKFRPYPGIEEILRSQIEREFVDIHGDLVGFRFPGYLAGVQVAGYHLHFLNDARTEGGHMLHCRIRDVTASIDRAAGLKIAYGTGGEFDALKLKP